MLERLETFKNEPDFLAQKQAHIERDLIVAAARGVEFAPSGSNFFRQPPLDIHMNVLVAGRKRKFAPFDLALNCFQPAHDFVRASGGDDPLAR